MHANEAFDELTDEQKHICEILFKAITEKRGESFGIRRPTRLNEIASIADCSEDEVIDIIEKFREPGRSLLTPAFGTPISSKSMIDISHESLMRIWVRLKNWVDDEADAVQMYVRLAEAASMYQEASRFVEATGFTISIELAGKAQTYLGVGPTLPSCV